MVDHEEVLEKVLADLLADAKTADKVLKRCCEVGILEKDGCDRYVYTQWKHYERGGWLPEKQTFAKRLTSFNKEERKSFFTGLRFGDQIASPGGFLAKLIEKHREKLQKVAKLEDSLPD